MDAQQIACPFCQQPYTIPPEQAAQYIGQQVPCSNCQKLFMVVQEGPTLRAVVPYASALSYQPSVTAPTNGLAIAGLVCGICGFITCGAAGIAGLICSIMGLQKSRQTGTGRGMAIAGIVVSSISLLLMAALPISILLPSLSNAREKANQIKCASNLRMIGQATMFYAQGNLRAGAPLGPGFPALLTTPVLSPQTFVCPSDSNPPVGQLGNAPCSYIWVGSNLKMSSNSNCVVAYEPLSNHGGRGINLLFVDGHVEFVSQASATQIIKALNAGINPPPNPNSPPAPKPTGR
jgi:prepilin-type processing-associated H-X9-DG protein